MPLKIGDKVKVLDASKIIQAEENGFNTEGVYQIVEFYEKDPVICKLDGSKVSIAKHELPYIQKV